MWLRSLWLALWWWVGQDVKSNYMSGTNFAKYHAYKWISIEGGAPPNQIVDAEISRRWTHDGRRMV